MLAASGRLRLFTDADASTAMDQFDVLATALSDMGGRGIAFASIAVPGAVVVEPQRGIRPTAGRMGNRIIRAFVLPGIKDSQRGFKLFSGDVADDIFARCVVDGWAFDVEVLAIARKLNIGVREVPVIWMHKDDSRVTAASYVSTLMDVLRIRWRISTGAYSASIPDVVDTSS
jgi:dolichyl-phosphate beta-glucosyltransferase